MAARGAFDGLGRWELRGGTLHRMSPVHFPHGRIVGRLYLALTAALEAAGGDLVTAVETSINFGDGFTPTADIVVCEGDHAGFVPGAAVRLVAEVSQTTLADDLGAKARDYARLGLREYLVVDVTAAVIHQHWEPGADGFAQRIVVRYGEALALRTLAGVVVATDRLAAR